MWTMVDLIVESNRKIHQTKNRENVMGWMNDREKKSWSHNIAQSTLIKSTWTNKHMLSFEWRQWKGKHILILISNASTNGVFKNGVDIVTLDWLAMPANCKLLGHSGTLCTLCTVYNVYMQFNFNETSDKVQPMKSEISTDEKKPNKTKKVNVAFAVKTWTLEYVPNTKSTERCLRTKNGVEWILHSR